MCVCVHIYTLELFIWAKYAVVQAPLRFRFDSEVLVFSQAAPLPDVGATETHTHTHARTEVQAQT